MIIPRIQMLQVIDNVWQFPENYFWLWWGWPWPASLCVMCGVVLYQAIGHHHMFSMFCTEDGQYDPSTLHISVSIVKFVTCNLNEDSSVSDNNVIRLQALTRDRYLKNWVLNPDNGDNYLIITLFHFIF